MPREVIYEVRISLWVSIAAIVAGAAVLVVGSKR